MNTKLININITCGVVKVLHCFALEISEIINSLIYCWNLLKLCLLTFSNSRVTDHRRFRRSPSPDEVRPGAPPLCLYGGREWWSWNAQVSRHQRLWAWRCQVFPGEIGQHRFPRLNSTGVSLWLLSRRPIRTYQLLLLQLPSLRLH